MICSDKPAPPCNRDGLAQDLAMVVKDRYLAPWQARLQSSKLLPCQLLVGELDPGVVENEAGYLCPALGWKIDHLDVGHVHGFWWLMFRFN